MNSSFKILLLENIHPKAKEILEAEGHKVDLKSDSPSAKDLKVLLPKYDLVGIRSKTELTKDILQSAPNLLAVGCFCIGTNQVELTCAKIQGAPVFNAPHSNTRSVAELVIAELVMLSRQLGDRNTLSHQGGWMKSAEGAKEIRGKTLGIIGYGHIGSQVSIMAESMGLRVCFYDTVKKLPLGNARACTKLDELLQQSDFVTLHVPETPHTKEMMGSRQFKKMKKGSFLLNLSRGTVVCIDDLVEAIKEKHIAGAALDVFPIEPASNKDKFKSPLQNLPNVILTPHIGGSTEEAQLSIGAEVAESFLKFIRAGTTAGAVNFPHVELPIAPGSHRILNVHRNEPGVLAEINSLVSKYGANILGQQLATESKIGYMVMDVENTGGKKLADEIGKLDRSIRTRVVS